MPKQSKIITLTPPYFIQYLTPNGFLTPDNESHALWYYYLLANKNSLEEIDDYRLEDQFMPIATNYFNLYKSIAKLYNVDTVAMSKCWHQVDLQCELLSARRLPDKFRHPKNKDIIVINTKLH